MDKLKLKVINALAYHEKVVDLLSQLNPAMDKKYIEETLLAMTELPNYKCFALFNENELIGISSGWTTVRLYCGKQLELDNVIINTKIQSKGFGQWFINKIKEWATDNDYKSIGLNTYVQNSRSHKFYFNQDFKILGLHFEHTLKLQE